MVKRRPHDFGGGRTIKHYSHPVDKGNHYTVYRLGFPDGKQYVGVTGKSVEYRRDCGYGHNQRLKEAIRSCGWKNMEHEVLRSGLTQAEAFALEREYIAELDSTNPALGYNISPGGKSTFAGLSHTNEAKEKIRAANTGREFSETHRRNISMALTGLLVGEKNPNYGKHKSEETIQKQYDSHRHEMKRVIQRTMDGDVVGVFDSLHQAANKTGVSRNGISKVAKGNAKQAGGFLWEFDVNGGDVG